MLYTIDKRNSLQCLKKSLLDNEDRACRQQMTRVIALYHSFGDDRCFHSNNSYNNIK